MKNLTIVFLLLFIATLISSCGKVSHEPSLANGDWPQYRADAERTGSTPAALESNLSLVWVRMNSTPEPAWMGVHTRMIFDHACHPVISGQTLFYSSTVDCAVHALDTSSGLDRWSFFTNAPVRFAPVLWKDRLFVAGDDGFLYCLSAEKGSLLWKKRLAPTGDMVIGNDRMVARFPLRGGPVIADDTLYIGAGIWPSEGIYIYALNPENGDEIWCNDDSGSLEMNQPHGGARAKSGVSSQGYLVASGYKLFVPTGRSIPAAFDRKSGEFSYFHLAKYRGHGGSRVVAAKPYLFATSGNTRDEQEVIGAKTALFMGDTGELATTDEIDSPLVAATDERIYYVDNADGTLRGIPRSKALDAHEGKNRRGEPETRYSLAASELEIPLGEVTAISILAAGDKVVIGASSGKIIMADTVTSRVIWTAEVTGLPLGLASAHGKLYVSTDTGALYCFDDSSVETPSVIPPPVINNPYGPVTSYSDAADEIIIQTGITKGWCLDAYCGDGALAFELARKTELMIVAFDPDPANVKKARELLTKAGLYGSRVTVFEGELDSLEFPDYFANLAVSGRALTDKNIAPDHAAIERLLAPYGGSSCFGTADNFKLFSRADLKGAGDWKHQYHDAGNTITSSDELVDESLEVLWYKDDRFDMPSRHGRGIGPLYSEGRMFVQGLNGIRAYDAYNGTILWEYSIPGIQTLNDFDHALGTAVTHQNWCIDGDRLYVRVEHGVGSSGAKYIIALGTETGREIARYNAPDIAGIAGIDKFWGYLAVVDGVIYGSLVNYSHQVNWGWGTYETHKLFAESLALFAIDADSGDTKWTWRAKNSIRHNAIAIGNGRIHLIDRPVAKIDRKVPLASAFNYTPKDHPNGELVALQADSGKVLYRKRGGIYGTLLAYSSEHDILLMTYQYTRFSLASEFGGRMTAFDASSGKSLWTCETGTGRNSDYNYSSRPLLSGDRIYLDPSAYDLLSGEKLDIRFDHSYTCGIVAGAKNMLVYRSATLGYFDIDSPELGTQNYGGIRPGCWINAIPAGGLVLMPDATDRCSCGYLMKATIALKPSIGGL